MLVKRYLQRQLSALHPFIKYSHSTTSSSGGRYQSFLSEEQARNRCKNFEKNSLSYQLGLNLKEGAQYEGRVDISFALSQVSKEIFLDYAGSKIHEITINNHKIDSKNGYEYLRNNRFLNIPTDALTKGKNEVSIKFENEYSNDGNGLHSFTDTDKKQYIYSNCEPYAANKMFPCFDQPDLKGIFNLTVAAPKKWRVISNEHIKTGINTHLLRDFKINNETTGTWSFNPTPLLSTYLYTVIAGPYLELKCENPYNNISMSLFSRESLFEHLKKQAPEIFEVTIESMKFFEKFFGYPFPFSKYDQIFCPEYNMGAMENPGAVTFNDKYIFKEEVTRRAKSNLANTISHELSHMWFGDLVTMKWWNDLWLNESFAEFISHYCLANIELKTCKLEDFWYQFFQRKGWAYREDQLRTTHPIATQVLNTEQAENIFDGITYAKGAATLKQLLCLISAENFSKAMKNYFWTYQWSNATLDDFIKHLQECYQPNNPGFPKNLKVWQDSWLMTSGLNECMPVWEEGTYNLTIEQGYALEKHPTLRFHKMKVAFFDSNARIIKTEDCLIKDTARTELTFSPTSVKPAAVLLNYGDEAYIKIRLDKQSINFFKENLSIVEGELTRALIWRALFDMVRDAKLTSNEFVDIVVQNLPTEVEDSIIMTVLQYTQAAVNAFTPKKLRNLLNYKCFDTLHTMLKNTDPKNKNRVILLRADLLKFVDSPSHNRNVYDWFEGKNHYLKDYELGLNDRWSIVKNAFRDPKLTREEKERFYEVAAKADPSDTKLYVRKFCDALLLEHATREAAWKNFFDKDTKDSNHMIAEYMRGFNDESKLGDLKEYHDKYWDSLIEVFEHRSREYSKAFFAGLFPSGEDLDVYLKKIDQVRQKCPQNQITLKKLLDEYEDDLRRKKKAYDNFVETLKSL